MATKTYYSPFFPAVELPGAKGTTKPIVTTGEIVDIVDSIGKSKTDLKKVIDDNKTQVNLVLGQVDKDLKQLKKDLENVDVVLDDTPPSVPENLALVSTIVDSGADLVASWTPPSDNDLAGFDFSIREGSGPYFDYTTSASPYKLSGLRRNSSFTARVRAYDKLGNKSQWSAEVTHTTIRDTNPPGPVTNITAETSYETAFLAWINPSDADLSHVRVELFNLNNQKLRTVDVPAVGNSVGTVTFAKIAKATNYYVIIYASDTSKNESAGVQSGTFTTAGGVDVNDFTPGLQPIKTVPSLPNPVGYTGPRVVFNQVDGKLYRYLDNQTWVKEVDASDLKDNNIPGTKLVDGAIDTAKLANNAISNAKLANGAVETRNIVDLSVEAAKIADGAVTAKKLLVGDTTNYAADADFAQGGLKGWIIQQNAGTTARMVSNADLAYTGTNCFLVDANCSGVLRNQAQLPVVAGDSVYAFGYVHATAPNGFVRLRISWLNSAGAEVWTTEGPQGRNATGAYGAANYGRVEASFDYPAGRTDVRYARVEFVYSGGSGEAFVGYAGLQRRLKGELIVDGSIKANHLTTNSVKTGSIEANAITADKLLIKSNGAALNPDPNFVDPSVWAQSAGIKFVNITNGIAGNTALEISTANGSVVSNGWIKVDRAKTYRFHAMARRVSGTQGIIYAGVALSDAEGNNIFGDGTYWFYVARGQTIGNEWTKIESPFGFGTARPFPEHARQMSICLFGNYDSGIGVRYDSVHHYQDARIEEMMGATLIQDGAITTDKIYANAITSGKISTGAVNADKIAANSIAANKLVLASRPISMVGINMRIDTDGVLRWDAGTVLVVKDDGTVGQFGVRAGETGAYDCTIVFVPGRDYFDVISDRTVFLPNSEHIKIADRNGLSDLKPYAGVSTIISGDRIVTGSINANKIQARTIGADRIVSGALTANEIAAGTITAAQIATGALTARVLAVGNGDSIIPDADFRDAEFWTGGVPGVKVVPTNPSWPAAPINIFHYDGDNVFRTWYTPYFPVEHSATFRFRVWWYAAPNFSGKLNMHIHRPNVEWFNPFGGGGWDPNRFDNPNWSVLGPTPGVMYKEWVINNTGNEPAKTWQFRFDAQFTGNFQMFCSIVRISDTTLIKDGAITTDKITVNTLNGDRIQAGSLDADKIVANSIKTNQLSLGLQDKVMPSILNTGFWGRESISAQPNWNENQISSNAWFNGVSPNGGMEKVLRMVAVGTDANGGWNVNITPEEGWSKEKTYRYYTWVYLESGNNQIYHGTDNVANLSDGADAPNPYFMSFPKSYIAASKWYLMVGLVHGAGSSYVNTGQSGVYDPVTGQRVLAGNDYKWRTSATYGRFRSYQYYGDAGGVAYFTKPIVEEVISGRTASIKSLMQNLDYAQNINTGSTRITPGMIEVSGGTTLANWRNGGDNTKIEGGAIAANTITANKITVANRGVRIDRVFFYYDRASARLNWTDGHVFWTDNNGNATVVQIVAGSTAWLGGSINYIYWHQGKSTLDAGSDNWQPIGANQDVIMFCTWRGGVSFVPNYGGIILDGDMITAGSVNADRITAGTVLANTVVIGGSGKNVGNIATDVNNFTNDNVISRGEKASLMERWNGYNQRWIYVRDAASALGISYATLDSHYYAASNYLVSLSPGWSDVNSDTPVDGAHLRNLFNNLDGHLAEVTRTTSNEAASRSTWAKTTGTGKPADNATVGAPAGTSVGGQAAELIDSRVRNGLTMADTRDANYPPSYYYNLAAAGTRMTQEFKVMANIGVPAANGPYGQLLTTCQWHEPSGGPVQQEARDSGGRYWNRVSVNTDSWGAWNDTGAQINQGVTTIDGGKITAYSIGAEKIVAYSITGDRIAANTITGDRIAANTITAGNLSVGSLSAITANIGTLRTANTGGRMEIENNQIRIYDDNGSLVGLIGRLS